MTYFEALKASVRRTRYLAEATAEAAREICVNLKDALFSLIKLLIAIVSWIILPVVWLTAAYYIYRESQPEFIAERRRRAVAAAHSHVQTRKETHGVEGDQGPG